MTKQDPKIQGQFTGKTALITGGGAGIGRSAAIALAAEGCMGTKAAIDVAIGDTGRLDYSLDGGYTAR